jgi:hypothetical protein
MATMLQPDDPTLLLRTHLQPNFLQTATEGNADELHKNLRERSLQSLFFFAKVVLGYDKLVPHLHLDFCERIVRDEQFRKRGYLMPRGHFKSTIVSKGYSLWRLCRDRNKRILIIGESDTVGAKNLRDIQWNIQNNQLLRWLFPEIIPPEITKTKWTNSEILLPRDQSYDESSITTAGVGARKTGFHFDLIIYDDIIGEAASSSEATMNDAIEWFQYAPGLLDDPANGEEILIGTRWKHGNSDLYGHIMEQLPEEVQASGRSTGFYWYVRGAREIEEGIPDIEGTPIFPERFSVEVLEEIRKRQGDYKHACQYQNDPVTPGATDFPKEWIKEYTVDADRKLIIPCDGTPPIALHQLYRLSFYDPSAGGKSAKAENAIVVVGGASDRRIFFLEAWSKNCSFGDAIEEWHKINDKFICQRNLYEEIGAQKVVEDIVRERLAQTTCRLCDKTHRKLRPEPFHPPTGKGEMNKQERIRYFAQPPMQEGRIYLRKGAQMAKLKSQITSFPHGGLVDIFDAGASAIHNVRFPISATTLLEQREDEERRVEARRNRIDGERSYGGYC